MIFDEESKPEFTFRTEDETETELVYVVEGNGKVIKRKISKEDYINPVTRFEIQDQMTREAVMPNIPGVEF